MTNSHCSGNTGPESTLKEAFLGNREPNELGQNTAGTHAEQDWMIKNRLYPRQPQSRRHGSMSAGKIVANSSREMLETNSKMANVR